MTELVSTEDVAKLLGVPRYRLHGLIVNGLTPRPKLRVGKLYAWTPEEVKAARAAVKRSDERKDRCPTLPRAAPWPGRPGRRKAAT